MALRLNGKDVKAQWQGLKKALRPGELSGETALWDTTDWLTDRPNWRRSASIESKLKLRVELDLKVEMFKISMEISVVQNGRALNSSISLCFPVYFASASQVGLTGCSMDQICYVFILVILKAPSQNVYTYRCSLMWWHSHGNIQVCLWWPSKHDLIQH